MAVTLVWLHLLLLQK